MTVPTTDTEQQHRCAMPPLEAGQQWKCPGCDATWGQDLPAALANGTPIESADVEPPEVVNVGELLADVANALVETGHAFAPGVPPREAQAAFYRLGGAFARASKVFTQVGIAMPRGQHGG